MAKWGEGDPRWLVEDRPDATNVNNWHWTEKNASLWSKEKLEALLVGLKIESDVGRCEITEMSKCEGEAVVNNRKAKLIFLYEWVINLKWKGFLKHESETVDGSVEIPNLSEEHEVEDVDINISVDANTSDVQRLKDLMRYEGTQIIRKQLTCYLKCLKEEFSRGVILPTKDSASTNYSKAKANVSKNKVSINEKHFETINKGNVIETTDLQSTETFKCTAEEFYRALTDKQMVEAFTRGECLFDPVKGGKFVLFGGNVCGHFTNLVANKLIQQKWRFKSWPERHFSDVILEIKEKSDCTEVFVTQTGVPKYDVERTCDGWKKYYWESLKTTFGFGAMLF